MRGDFGGDFRRMERDGHAEIFFRLPFRVAETVITALLDHEHAAAAGLFHEAAQVKHMGDVGISEDREAAFC